MRALKLKSLKSFWTAIACTLMRGPTCGRGRPPAAADPIKIGLSMSLTGGLSGGGKSALLALQIWRDDVNAKGGLLGRPVDLVFYDDQSNPSTVPAIYT